VDDVTILAKKKGFLVENQGDLGISMRTNELSVNFMKKGSAVVVGSNDEAEAISLYKSLLGTKSVSA
jgi:adenylyltransferase/sulfurtransferase